MSIKLKVEFHDFWNPEWKLHKKKSKAELETPQVHTILNTIVNDLSEVTQAQTRDTNIRIMKLWIRQQHHDEGALQSFKLTTEKCVHITINGKVISVEEFPHLLNSTKKFIKENNGANYDQS